MSDDLKLEMTLVANSPTMPWSGHRYGERLLEIQRLRSRLEEVERERDEARRELAAQGGGTIVKTCEKHGATVLLDSKGGQRFRYACAQCQDEAIAAAEQRAQKAEADVVTRFSEAEVREICALTYGPDVDGGFDAILERIRNQRPLDNNSR